MLRPPPTATGMARAAQQTPIEPSNNLINGGMGLPPPQTRRATTRNMEKTGGKDRHDMTKAENHQYNLQRKQRRAENAREALAERSIGKSWDG